MEQDCIATLSKREPVPHVPERERKESIILDSRERETMKYLVLDTNVYLHYKDFEQIDWRSLLKDEVTICVPQRVFEEIDKHKDLNKGKIQRKAKRLSTRFSEIFLQGIAPRVPVEVLNHPLATAFDDPQFHKEISDDWIILSALQCAHDKDSLIIVSGDNGILLKAKMHDLGYLLMPDDLLLTEEASEEEKEIRQLRQQLAKYETRCPDPIVEFEGETPLLTIEKPQFINVKDELAAYEMELKGSHAYQPLTDASHHDDLSYLMGFTQLAHSTLEQRQEYNKELDEYFEKKLKQKEFQLGRDFMEQRFRGLKFLLSNVGTASLGDTTVFLTFPPEVKVYSKESKLTIRVDDPAEPVLKNNLNSFGANLMSLQYGHKDKKEDIEIWAPNKPLDHHEFKYHSHRLTHMMFQNLNSKEEIFIDIAQCGNFAISWTVIDSELIDSVKGELHVVIKESDAE